MNLDGKVSIVTGAGSGIGRATARLFSRNGARVVVADVSDSDGVETARQIVEDGGDSLFVHVDVAKSEEVMGLVETTMDHYGRIDILFNNAGVTIPARVTETSQEMWQRSLDVNLKSVMLGCKYALPEMINNKGGSIINTASMLGLVVSPAQASYCSAKGGVVMLTKQVAIDYAQYNVRVNCICPSEVNTPMHRTFVEQSSDPEATRRRLMERIPLGRVAEPGEIASVALFLASDDSSYITGVALPVDGGLTAT
jgi:NAD(P)-dependent dehydrogenase (short-subunit alcohol dehydrogenase family)